MWVWNTPRDGYPGNPKNPNYKGQIPIENSDGSVTVTFRNSGINPEYAKATLYYTDQYWGPLGHNDIPISIKSYVTHVWNVRLFFCFMSLFLPFLIFFCVLWSCASLTYLK